MVGLLIVSEAASFILAGALVRLAVIGAGYTLGSQKIPWKSAIVAISLLTVLHAGKGDMRAAYWQGAQGTQKFGVLDYHAIFAEWLGAGMKVLATGKSKDDGEVHSAAERGAMIAVLFRILEWTPSRKPFLEGETYKGIPTLLIPRVLYKEKGISHMGNWILAYQYEFLTLDELGKTSVGFDLISEAYANYGYLGIGFLAVLLSLFYGLVGRLSTGVPLLSTRFLFAVLVLSGTLSSNNTMGVFVTTLWQSAMALLTVAFVLTKKLPNPLYVQTNNALTKNVGLAGSGRGQGAEKATAYGLQATGEMGVGGHPSSLPQKHERPTRFVYGKKKGN